MAGRIKGITVEIGGVFCIFLKLSLFFLFCPDYINMERTAQIIYK